MSAFDDSLVQVSFRNPAWRTAAQVELHRATIREIENYAATAQRQGLFEEEIAADLNEGWPHLGTFSCEMDFPPDEWNSGRMVVSVC